MTHWTERAHALADTLQAEGAITDPAWHAAFAATPRHVFVPRFYAMDQYNSPRTLVSGDAPDPQERAAWLDAVYRNQVLVTGYEVAGHHDDGTEIRVPTSSASQPSIVATMLDRLKVSGGETVLEIGTGTGYNTALLCHRFGPCDVASVDIDADLVVEADARLAGVGYLVADLVATDGVNGLPGRTYDRILATCSVPGIPPAWINQLADGGIIVAPLTFAGALAVVTKTGADEVSGHLDAEEAWFMRLRPAGQPVPDTLVAPPPAQSEGDHGTTEVDLASLTDADFRLWLTVHLPDAQLIELTDDTGHHQTGVQIYTATGAATVTYHGSGGSRVVQDEQRLWDAVQAAWLSWRHHGSPARSRFGLTACADGRQRIWLDTPDSPHWWPLPGQWWGTSP